MTKTKLNSVFKEPNNAFQARIKTLMEDSNVRAVMIAKKKDYPTQAVAEYQVFTEEVY